MPRKLKMKLYVTVLRPVLLYDFEACAAVRFRGMCFDKNGGKDVGHNVDANA